VICGLLITVLRKPSAPYLTIGVVVVVGMSLFFVLPTLTSVTTDTFQKAGRALTVAPSAVSAARTTCSCSPR
jgi:hypothetical protein